MSTYNPNRTKCYNQQTSIIWMYDDDFDVQPSSNLSSIYRIELQKEKFEWCRWGAKAIMCGYVLYGSWLVSVFLPVCGWPLWFSALCYIYLLVTECDK